MLSVASATKPALSTAWTSLASTPWMGLVISAVVLAVMWVSGSLTGYSATTLVGIGLVAWLAVENGGNDVSKGVAPLVAAGQVGDVGALIYGTAVTIVGSLLSIYLSAKVLKLFTSGLINTGYDVTGPMMLAIAVGASLWVALATYYSLPVSTTHAIIGSVITVGSLAYGSGGVAWANLVNKVVIPLLFSPVTGLTLAWVVSALIARVRLPESIQRSTTWLTCGAINFVRALNDTPKIVAIAFFAAIVSAADGVAINQTALYVVVTLAMALGSFIKGLPILQLLARKVTKLDTNLSLSASLTSAGLVLASSRLGLPVSTTHVTTSSILGAGLRSGVKSVNWKVVRDMGLSWIVTLPGAGLIGGLTYLVTRMLY
jgi:inorganic phosphate transporter, PiT family